jgi:hypothetical protein
MTKYKVVPAGVPIRRLFQHKSSAGRVAYGIDLPLGVARCFPFRVFDRLFGMV